MVSDNNFCFEERWVKILKIGKIDFKDRVFPTRWNRKTNLCSMTIERSASGNFYVAILFEVQKAIRRNTNTSSLELDFSPSEMYVSSENQTGKDFGYVAQKQAHKKQLRKLERRLARKQKDSSNRNKARTKVARLEEHIANSRKDWIEKETLRLVSSYKCIVVEDLNLKGISAFLRNAKNMNDTSWAMFVSRLQAKGEEYSCKVIKADRYFPSSQLCNVCGFQYKDLKLSERTWICPKCGTNHIRDVNAAINLMKYVPLEERELTPVDSDTISKLAMLALQAETLDEAGKVVQATLPRNVPGL